MEWFRFYSETVTDPKIRGVAARAGFRVADVVAVWVAILCHASDATPRGSMSGWDDDDQGANLGMAGSDVAAIRAAMSGGGRPMIADGMISGWAKRQPTREDPTAADRQRRKRSKNNGLDNDQPSSDVGAGHAESRNVTQSHDESRLDKNRLYIYNSHGSPNSHSDVTTLTTPSSAPFGENSPQANQPEIPDGSSGALQVVAESNYQPKLTSSTRTKPERSKRGTRIPHDWMPSPDLVAFAEGEGFTRQQIDREAASFVDYWLGVPGANGVKLDWDRTWKNRIRSRADQGRQHATQAQRQTTQGAMSLAREAASGGVPLPNLAQAASRIFDR